LANYSRTESCAFFGFQKTQSFSPIHDNTIAWMGMAVKSITQVTTTSMNREHFHVPGALWVERQRHRDAPDCYVVWIPRDTRSGVLAAAKWPASTPTGQALREWLDSHAAPTLTPNTAES
jgi:hypothetical protein